MNEIKSTKTIPNLSASRYEPVSALLIILSGIVLRIYFVFTYHIDSDEPQHLHVVWSWICGMVQYRDVFDNHMPLFHILCIPLMRLFGETGNIIIYMRLAVLPLTILSLFVTYILGSKLFSRRVGLWSCALLGVYPAFFFCSLQYRTDVLWMLFWILSIFVFLCRPLNRTVSFLSGFLIGAAFCTSNKTILLLFSLITAVFFLADFKTFNLKKHIMHILYFSTGIIILPLLTIAFFAYKNALKPFLYCTITHNIIPGVGHWQELWRTGIFFFILILLLCFCRFYYIKNNFNESLKFREILFLHALIYFLSLFSLWPIVTRQNFLPVYPFFVIFIIYFILRYLPLRIIRYFYCFLVFFLLEATAIFVFFKISNNNIRSAKGRITDALNLTSPDQFIFDQKGETVYRKRPYYFKFESMTRERFDKGLIRDNIIDSLINTRCCVSSNNISKLSKDIRDFLFSEFISVGYLRVAGRYITPETKNGMVYRIKTYIPSTYIIEGEFGIPDGIIDGARYNGPVYLSQGNHEFILKSKPQKLAVYWFQAKERGFSPFTALKND